MVLFVHLLLLEELIVDSAQVVVVELYVGQLRAENVHLAAVFKNDFVVKMQEGLCGFRDLSILHEGFPDLGFFEDEYLDDGTVGTEELIEIVMGDDIAKLIVDADQEDGPLRL